jgi:glycosyltransferase involved in cell wall biosynthesis
MSAKRHTEPLFSIIIAFYNQEAFVRDAVESALNVEFKDVEVIAVDDASPDGTLGILEDFAERIRIIRNSTNIGACASRNEGASIARGRFLVFLDGDDLLFPWSLDLYARIIDLKDPKILLSSMQFFEGKAPRPDRSVYGNKVQIVELEKLANKDYTFRGSASAMIIEKGVYIDIGGFDDDSFPVDTDDLLIKLSHSGKTIHILSFPTVGYRIHANNTIKRTDWLMENMLRIFGKLKRDEYPGGAVCRRERYAFYGKIACYWVWVGLKRRLYRRSAELIIGGGFILACGLWARVRADIFGRKQIESVPF